jgi:transposase
MTSRDARTISPNTQFEIRRQAVRLQQGGYKISTIAKLLEVDRNTVGKWLRKFKEGGFESLKPKKRGRKNGTKMQLSQKIQDTVRKLLIEKHPYLNRWGFTPQRPIKRAYQRDDKKVKEWMEETYPSIKKRAKSEGAEIHWADEVGIKSHDHRGRGYSPRGKTPVRMHNPSYEKVNMISSVTNQGTLQFMCYDGSFNYRIFHEFLKQLIKSSRGRKVFVIVDHTTR